MRSSSLVPGAMEAGLDSLLFWGSLALALAVAFCRRLPRQPLADRAWPRPRRRPCATIDDVRRRRWSGRDGPRVCVGARDVRAATSPCSSSSRSATTVRVEPRRVPHLSLRILRDGVGRARAGGSAAVARAGGQESGTELLSLTGLSIRAGDSATLRSALDACSAEYEVLAPAKPGGALASMLEGEVVLELHGGIVRADRALAAFSRRHPVETGVQVLALRPARTACRSRRRRGTIDASLAVVAAGAWATPLLADAGIELETNVSQETVAYFDLPRLAHLAVGHRLERGNGPARVLAGRRRKRPQGRPPPLGRGGRARRAGRPRHGRRRSSVRVGAATLSRPPIPRPHARRDVPLHEHRPTTASSPSVMGRSSVARHARATASSSRRPSAARVAALA